MMNAELETVKDLARRAGAILMEHYAGDPSVQWKGRNDPVTSADLAASHFLVDELRLRFPSDAILSEEEKDESSRLTNSRVWIIDPMDGTREFISRRGEFAVMIGLAINGQSQLGAVYQPTEDKLYFAAPGAGCHLSCRGVTTRLHVSERSDLTHATMALSRSHLSQSTELIRKRLEIAQTIQTGSLGIKIGLICEARADIYVQGRGTSLWDTCGPEAILREAGGKLTDSQGNAFLYNRAEVRNLNGVIATNGLFHDRVVETVRAMTDPS
jgi:3'(2'), 5'-bisphosphate nucleotidase